MTTKTESKQKIRQKLLDWLTVYEASVGKSGQICGPVLDQLLAGPISSAGDRARLLDLLEYMSSLSPDSRTVCTAMIHVAEQCGGDTSELARTLPKQVRNQLKQLHTLLEYESQGEISRKSGEDAGSGTQKNAEGLRRLLLALVQDVRVVLIVLAWQLVLLRQAKGNNRTARDLATETMLIHAPLANRLGVWQLKWELEDLAFRFLDPEQYQRIAELVAEHRTERERFIEGFIEKLSQALTDAGISADVRGRPKHIYSIWRKMQRKGIDFDELFDVRAVRVLVDDLPACYSALGLVHTLWQPIPGEFDDYVTTPKGNNYQSLHTAVTDRKGRAVEVQIRTKAMHEHAELGVAAHWRYKEGGPTDPAFDNKIAVMRQLMDSAESDLDDQTLLDSFQSATSEDRVYVLTPRGQVVDLAAGATVLDFAYHVHTEVGHRCRGAKVNGRIVPITTAVNTGDRIEILTGKNPHPSRDWLNPKLGYIHGARARAKVRQWFKKESRADNLKAGKESIEAELKRMGITVDALESVAVRFSLAQVDDLFVAIGNGDLTAGQVMAALERMHSEAAEPQAEDLLSRTPARQKGRKAAQPDDFIIEGVGNLMSTIAKCCMPVPGDPVIGYITQGRGVTIHRKDCRQVMRWQRDENPRLLQVTWGTGQLTNYEVRILIRAFERRELIKDISGILAASDAQVTDISSKLDETLDEVSIRLNLRVRDFEQLSELLNRLSSVPNVLEARRLAEGATA
jgi:GTP pyrophosphokinase